MKDSLMLFGVTLAKRCTKRQKRIFYSQAVPYFQKLGYPVEFQESKEKLNKISNIIIGDVEKATKAVLCPYDTPTRSLLPYKYYPFNWKNNLNQEYLHLVLNFLLYAIFGGLLFYFINFLPGISATLKTAGFILLIVYLFFSYTLIWGLPNPVNFNKNSASLALLAELAKEKSLKENTCFILLDKNTTSSEGLKLLSKDERFNNKIFIYLDCIASGEKFASIHTTVTNEEAKKLKNDLSGLDLLEKIVEGKRLEETSLQFHPKMIHLCTGRIKNQTFVVLNTRSKKDYQIDLPRLERIRDGLLTFLKG